MAVRPAHSQTLVFENEEDVARHLPRLVDSYNERGPHSAHSHLSPKRFEEEHPASRSYRPTETVRPQGSTPIRVSFESQLTAKGWSEPSAWSRLVIGLAKFEISAPVTGLVLQHVISM